MKNNMKSKKKWHWPPARFGELYCRHRVGHGLHIHGCDGCCNSVEFDEAWVKRKVLPRIINDQSDQI